MATDVITFNVGKLVLGKWKVKKKLGSGGCGSVYLVEDVHRPNYMAALKPILDGAEGDGVLKLEAAVLKKLKEKKDVVRLLDSGKRLSYNFIVMTLCGSDLMTLRRNSPEGFCENTLIRIGIQALYAIKQLHELGYIHRDVKPGNMMSGTVGRDSRVFYLIDYGMTRSLTINVGGKPSLRAPRKNVLLRGTLRYCSRTVHRRGEQGRCDDLWSMMYMLCELYVTLPWSKLKTEKEIQELKEKTNDTDVFADCPQEFVEIASHLRTLGYADRPDYYKIYQLFMRVMQREDYSFCDLFDWEKETSEDVETALEYSEREKKNKKALPVEEREFLLYPNTHPSWFKEKVLPF